MLEKIARGALGGLAGTLAHTAVMLAARTFGLGGKLPPKKITERMLEHLGVHADERTTEAIAVANHVGFGVATGALFGIAMPRMSRGKAIVAGAAYGLAIWLASYEGWAPTIGALPRARRDRPDRQAMMIAAHLAFGAALGAVAARPQAAEPEAPMRADATLVARRDVAERSAITES